MEEIEALKTENESLKARENHFKTQLAVSLKKIKKLEEYIIHLENQGKNVWERKEIYSDPGLNNEFKIMRELLQEKDQKIQKLEEEIKGLQFASNTSAGKKLIEKCKMLQEENEEFEKQISKGVIQNYNLEIAELKKQLKDNEYEMHKLREENAELRKENTDLEDTVESYRKGLRDSRNKTVQLQKDIDSLKERASIKV